MFSYVGKTKLLISLVQSLITKWTKVLCYTAKYHSPFRSCTKDNSTDTSDQYNIEIPKDKKLFKRKIKQNANNSTNPIFFEVLQLTKKKSFKGEKFLKISISTLNLVWQASFNFTKKKNRQFKKTVDHATWICGNWNHALQL